ncbi:MAG: hypothetical protein ACRD4Q_12065 [Candidatus Acidiferrales bacterium]
MLRENLQGSGGTPGTNIFLVPRCWECDVFEDQTPAGIALKEKANRGFRGYPTATVTFYGPDDRRASKVAVAIVPREGAEAAALERWFSEYEDIRSDVAVAHEILAFLRRYGAKSVAMADRIIGCPHEEGIDYPEGEVCPQCRFWAQRDRWTGGILQ